MKIQVDVIIPNYNQTTLLSRAVESALIQGDAINKIIIIDDGSNQETIEYLSHYFSGHEKINVIQSTRYNHPGIMRELGLRNSDSEWVAFLDADDFWESKKIERQLKFAIENNFDMVSSNGYIFRDSIKVKRMYEFESAPRITTKSLFEENIIINSSTLIRRDCFQKIGGYSTEYHLRGVEDFSTWLKVSVHFRIGFLNEELVNYEDLKDSFSKQQNPALRNIALMDFLFWSKGRTSALARIYSKFYLCRVLGRA